MSLPYSRALVTGGAGFVGSHIVDALAASGIETVVLDDFSSGRPQNLAQAEEAGRVKIVKGNVTDPDATRLALDDVDVVFHQAARVSVQESITQPELTRQVNTGGTRCLLEASLGGHVEKFILASTAAVYGDSKVLPRTEDAEPNPLSPYGESKLEAERLCLEAQQETGFDATVLRYFNIYGPRSTAKQYAGVLNEFAERLVSGRAVIIYGDGRQTRDFVHVSDIVSANMLVASLPKASRRVFNVGTGVQTSVSQLAQLEHDMLLGDQLPLSVEYRDARKGDVTHSCADISRFKELAGFSPKFPLRHGLASYLQWKYPDRKLVQTG